MDDYGRHLRDSDGGADGERHPGATARQLNPCVGDYGGVAVLEAGMTLRGSYVGQDCSGSVTASFSVIRQ